MNPRPFVHLAVLGAALAQLSCATTGLTPLPHSQPAERIGLAPEYRVFYDALKDDGDWVYVQPLGYVFRPNVNFITWRPYQDGFWVPSDLYGWVWISAESFGWATYHYGQWLYDRYYGWVWTPGLVWGPAWVAWQVAGDYAGWSPLLVPSPVESQISGGAWTYAPLAALGTTDLSSQVVHESDLSGKIQEMRPVENFVERGGAVFNRGPKFELVEKRVGALKRVKIEEPAVMGAAAGAGAARTVEKPGRGALETAEATRRAAAEAARITRELVERGGRPPASLTIVRPALRPPEAEGKPVAPAKGPPAGRTRGPEKGAGADSLHD